MKISDHYPVEVQLKSRIHPVLEKSVRFHRNAAVFDDVRSMPKKFSVENPEKFEPFDLDLFFDGSRHLAQVELSAQFPDPESAASGLKKLRENAQLPYSLFALARNQILELNPDEMSVSVNICHKFRESKTTIFISQVSGSLKEL